jgi:hypothetical protein
VTIAIVAIAAIAIAFLCIVLQALAVQNQRLEAECKAGIAKTAQLERDKRKLQAKLSELVVVADVWTRLPRRLDANRSIAIALFEEGKEFLERRPEVAWWLRECDDYMTSLGRAFGADYNENKYGNHRPAISTEAAFGPLTELLEKASSSS